jgi:membrane protease YdiL (CAAX protease family)
MISETNTPKVQATEKVVAASLIAFFLTLVFGYLWWGRFEYNRTLLLTITYVGSFSTVVFSHLYFRDRRKQLGLRFHNFREALGAAFVPNLILLAIMAAWGFGSSRFSFAWDNALLLYIPWALLQQYVLQNFLLARFASLCGRGVIALLLASATFALIHLPNSALVVASLVGALIWCRVFLRVPNLFVVTLSHALLGAFLVMFFKFSGLDQLQVGRPGYAFRGFGDGVIVAAGYDQAGQPFIATIPGHDRATPSLVKVFTPGGGLRAEWIAFPEHGFSGNLAVGDVGFGGGDEIIVAPGPGSTNPPAIKVFDLNGRELSSFRLNGFSGYGASVSVYEGLILVCPGPGPDRDARFFEFRPDGYLVREWDLGAIGFHNSVRAARFEMSGSPKGPELLVWGNILSVNGSDIKVLNDTGGYLDTWQSYGTAFGVHVSLIHLGPNNVGVLTGPGSAPGHGPRIKIFDGGGNEIDDFFGYEDPSPCGTHVAAVDIDGDAVDELILGEGICPGQPAVVRVLDRKKNLISRWKAY